MGADVQPIVVWLRNDLRMDDHEPLWLATLRGQGHVVPVYCVDPRMWANGPLGFPKMGAKRAQFVIEALAALRARLQKAGGDLVIRVGHPEAIIPQVAASVNAKGVYYHEEPTREERTVADAVIRAVGEASTVQSMWGATLYHVDDLPYPAAELPSVFTNFRKDVERQSRVRPPRDAPKTLQALPDGLAPGELPCLSTFNDSFVREPLDERGVIPFKGGEDEANTRLQAYFWEHDALQEYKETRNGLIGANYSSKFSPWLALGCISPRRIWQQVQAYERQRVKNDSTYWLIFELIWRDFFRFLGVAAGTSLFKRGGVRGRDYEWSRDKAVFARWCEGQTGVPFIDANMRELSATGFMSNRGRQNVGSFLAKTLKVDWRWGAAWFESTLIDYDPTSNWGNWQYVSGVGNDPRDRVFNVVGQAKRYDANGAFVRRWCPELKRLPDGIIHEPDARPARELQRFGVELGVNYPRPILDMQALAREYEQRNKSRGRGRNRGNRGRNRRSRRG
ncbi:MAG: DASH family cryptochrome [Myxococcota bacterium]